MALSWISIFALLVLASTCAAEDHQPQYLTCNANKICGESDRTLWLNKRNQAMQFVEFFKENPEVDIYSPEFTHGIYARIYNESTLPTFSDDTDSYMIKRQIVMDIRSELCLDKQTAGYLMNNESDTWPLACLWTGSDINGTCSPAPPSSSTFDFVNANEWREKVREFRNTIKCKNAEIQAADYIHELYICREGCIQAGVSYMFALFIMLSMLLVIGALCF